MSMKKQFALTLASVGIGAALIGGGTFAYFNDTETSSGNTFSAGTIDLKPETEAFTQLNVGPMKPGQTSAVQTINLSNAGNLDANALLDVAYTASGGKNNADLGTQLLVKNLKFKGTTINVDSIDGSDNKLTLKELADGTAAATKLLLGELAANNGAGALTFEVEFEETNTDQNDYQGSSVSIDLTFEARQK